ncbi:hypothetical protein NFI96_024028 [Prochilodus magdalenae]|nr:hypothetical protein NFI96_024028 [Prochilodus magdalenae]
MQDTQDHFLEDRSAITPPDNQPAKSTKTVGFALAAIGWILAMVTCFLPMWVVTTSSESTTSIGLWMVCVKQSTGQLNCQFGLPLMGPGSSKLKNVYFLTLCSIVMPLEMLTDYFRKSNGFIYITLCIRIKASKRNCIIMCGVCSIIAGIFLVIPVAEIAYIINYISKFYPTYDHYSGASIYIGFAAAALYGIGGVLLCCACRTEEGQ